MPSPLPHCTLYCCRCCIASSFHCRWCIISHCIRHPRRTTRCPMSVGWRTKLLLLLFRRVFGSQQLAKLWQRFATLLFSKTAQCNWKLCSVCPTASASATHNSKAEFTRTFVYMENGYSWWRAHIYNFKPNAHCALCKMKLYAWNHNGARYIWHAFVHSATKLGHTWTHANANTPWRNERPPPPYRVCMLYVCAAWRGYSTWKPFVVYPLSRFR